jgi:hypothetical protein
MRLFEYHGADRREISRLDLTDGRPVLIHLGDHLRVRDMYIDAKFHDYLERMRGGVDARIVAPVIENSSQDELLGRRMIFNRASGAPSDFAAAIYDATFRPVVDACADPHDEAQLATLRKNLSRMAVSAYSYGTSLLQQIAHVMAGDVAARFGADDDDRGMKAYDICRSVKALAIGSTSRLRRIEANGDTAPLRWDDAGFAESHTVFSQMLFQMRHDRAIINALNGDEAIGGLDTSETGIEWRETLSAGQVIDYTPPPTIKRIGFTMDAEGRAEAKILRRVDELVHGDSSYTYMHERQGDAVTGQTLAMTPVLRAASRAMLDPELDGRDWLKAMRAVLADQDQRRALVAGREASAREIDLMLSRIDAAPEAERGGMARDYVAGHRDDSLAAARLSLTDRFAASARHFERSVAPIVALSPLLRGDMARIVAQGLGRD